MQNTTYRQPTNSLKIKTWNYTAKKWLPILKNNAKNKNEKSDKKTIEIKYIWNKKYE